VSVSCEQEPSASDASAIFREDGVEGGENCRGEKGSRFTSARRDRDEKKNARAIILKRFRGYGKELGGTFPYERSENGGGENSGKKHPEQTPGAGTFLASIRKKQGTQGGREGGIGGVR